MLQKFQKHLHQQFPFLKGKKILLAISGGIDSVVLGHLFYRSDLDLSFAHCNFRLRGIDSDKDEIFVNDLAQKWETPSFVTRFDTEEYALKNNISIQMAARELRYEWFEELRVENQFDYIATAHNADDNLETFLINFTRGTGLEGLTGIPEINEKIIRPLLSFSRAEIEDYAKINHLVWREDASNAETKYLRNKLRHDVIPVLKVLNPGLLDSFSNTISHLQGAGQIVDDRIDDIQKTVRKEEGEIIRFDIDKINDLNNPKAYLYELLKKYGFNEWDDVADLLNAQTGKQVFSKTHRLLKDREFLILGRVNGGEVRLENIEIKDESDLFKIQNSPAGKMMIEEIDKEEVGDYRKPDKKNVFVDKDLLKYPLHVRKWEKGDYFYPIGLQGKKKLSKYFKDEKLSLIEKENIWLLCSENEIVWVIGKRPDDRFKITDKTKNILKIEII
ncbi:MAG: tRNA lysidine(34) synthetase TilS [Bacteroidota bacterium]